MQVHVSGCVGARCRIPCCCVELVVSFCAVKKEWLDPLSVKGVCGLFGLENLRRGSRKGRGRGWRAGGEVIGGRRDERGEGSRVGAQRREDQGEGMAQEVANPGRQRRVGR